MRLLWHAQLAGTIRPLRDQLMVIEFEVPLIEADAASVAVIVADVPIALSVTLGVPTPNVSVILAGNAAELSVLVKCTVPP